MIQTNDYIQSHKTITITGNVLEPVVAMPKQIMLGLLSRDGISEGNTRLSSPYGSQIEIRDIRHIHGDEVKWRVESDASDTVNLIVVAGRPRNEAAKVFKSTLEIAATAGDEDTRLRVEIYGIVAGRV
jgi:hypothetical protein